MKTSKCIFGLILAAALSAPPTFAQSGTATLRGAVRDPNGAAIADILVTVTGMDTAITREFTTGPGGNYSVPLLPPGRYKISVAQKGYEMFVAEDIWLAPGQVRLLDPKVSTALPDDAPPVRLNDPPIHPENGTVTEIIPYAARWPDAPIVEKTPSPLPLLTTAPGVQGNGRGLIMSGISDRNRQTWAWDGIADDTGSNPIVHSQFFEAAEMSVANPGVDAYRPTGFNLMSKRGGNSFHGQAYYKRGSAAFDARPYFDAKKNSYTLQEEGGEVGGQFIPNRTFFYGGGTYQRNPYRRTMYADVPTKLMRARDFSQFLDPTTSPTGTVVVIRDPRNGVPFPGNVIPSNRLNTVATNALNNGYIPEPNTGADGAVSQNYSWDHPFGPDLYRGVWPFLRFDQNLAEGHNLYFRWMESRTSTIAPGSLGPLLASTQAVRYRSFALAETSTLTSSLVNQVSLARISNRVKQGQEEGDVTPRHGDSALTTLGILGTNLNGSTVAGFPTISIAGLTGLSMVYPGGTTENMAQDDRIVTFEDGLVWSRGRHSVKLGAQYTHFDWLLGATPQNVFGSFSFNGMFTGIGFADFLLGFPSTSSRLQGPKLNQRLNQDQVGAYVSDSFRVTSRLTVDYGLRWDRFGSPAYQDGFMYNWDPATGNVIVAPGTLTSVSSLYPKNIKLVAGQVVPTPNNRNFRPRISAALRLTGNLVLRGGYGEFTDSGGFGADGRLNNPNGPYHIEETYFNSNVNGNITYTLPRPFPATASAALTGVQSVTAIPLKTDEGVIRQYNATLERAFGNLALRASYIGSRGVGMNYSLDVNKPAASTTQFSTSHLPYPQFGSTFVTRTDGSWRYDAVQLAASKRTGGLTFDSSVTLGNSVSNYANTFDPYHVTNQWTRDAANRRFYFVSSAQWAVPAGKGKRFLANAGPLADRLVRDWTVQAIVTAASGQYYSPLFTGPDPANASPSFVTALADCVGDPSSGARTISRWFNPAAFSIPSASAGRYGTCGMNSLEGYPIHVGHVSLAKRVQLGEYVAAVFTVQVSNVTNTPHFTFPNNNISNPGAGAFPASSAVSPYNPERQGSRQLDLKLRLQW